MLHVCVCAPLCKFYITHCSLIYQPRPWPTCEKDANAAYVSVRFATVSSSWRFSRVRALVADNKKLLLLHYSCCFQSRSCFTKTNHVYIHLPYVNCWYKNCGCAHAPGLYSMHSTVTCHCQAALVSNRCQRRSGCQVISSNWFYS